MSEPPRELSVGASVRAGARAIAPITVGVAPFGIIAGLAAVEIGLRLSEAIALSTIVYAGASQLAAIDLLDAGAPWGVAVLTVVVINLRLAMYSASLAPHLAAQSLPRRLGAAYVLTDQAYAVSVARFLGEPEPRARRLWFFLGAAVPLWAVWQAVTVVGAVAGDAVPRDLPMGFAVPLAFLALLRPAVTDRPTLAAALAGGTVATLGLHWPANLGMPAGALTGVAVGFALARRAAHREREAGPWA